MRRPTVQIKIGSLWLGSAYPVRVQSMTNTDTANIKATVSQIIQLADAGSELVRLTVNTAEAASQLEAIKDQLIAKGYEKLPLVGDFHFNGDRLLRDYPGCGQALDKYRINPGNVAQGSHGDDKFAFMIEQAIKNDKVIRIGVNWGSLDKKVLNRLMDDNRQLAQPLNNEAMVEKGLVISALESAGRARKIGLPAEKIILSCKVSKVQQLISVYRELASRCVYPLHLGLTEAGLGSKGIVASSAALAILLQEGIGDTIRLSLTPIPGEPRTKEVKVAQELLQSMDLRSFMPSVTACPGCGRTTSIFFQKMALEIHAYLEQQMPIGQKIHPGVENRKVAVMGCVVNGPGESKLANIGISLPGAGEVPVAPVYVDGKKTITLRGEGLVREFIAILKDYVNTHYPLPNATTIQTVN